MIRRGLRFFLAVAAVLCGIPLFLFAAYKWRKMPFDERRTIALRVLRFIHLVNQVPTNEAQNMTAVKADVWSGVSGTVH